MVEHARATPGTVYLVPISGPPISPITLAPRPSGGTGSGGLTLGRHDQCDLCLPADAEKVSRHHARFSFDSGRWKLADLNSRWGTFLNGVKIEPGPEVPLSEGDLLRITP